VRPESAAPFPGPAFVLDGSVADLSVLGGKGAALDRLVAWHLPVPRSGAVTVSAHRALIEDPGVRELIAGIRAGVTTPAETVDESYLAASLDESLAAAIVSVAAEVGEGGNVAVRSSATVEDLAGSSFAGQYRSFLDVDSEDPDAVLRAVRLVLASLWHPAPCAYRKALGIDDHDAAMCALFMQMVPAVTAGVVFTVDPMGSHNAARIEAVDGLGESLVSGRLTPEAWTLDRDAPPTEDVPTEISEALRLALMAERHAGVAQDIEWAWDGSLLWLVQARPITVDAAGGDGFDDGLDDEDLTTAGIAEMLPGVLPPLLWELVSHLVEEAFRRVSEDLGMSTADGASGQLMLRRVRGRAAMDFGRFQTMASTIPGGAVSELEEQYFGSRRTGRPAAAHPATRSRLRGLRHGLRVVRAQRRNTYEAETIIEAVRDLARDPVELDRRTDAELMAYRLALVDLGVRTMTAELGVSAAAAAAHRRVELLLLPHLGPAAAGRETALVTSSAGVAVTPEPESSAAVFGGPTWRELGRQPPVLAHSQRSDTDPLDELQARLRQVGSWGADSVRGALRSRTLTTAARQAIDDLGRRESTKAAVLRLGGEVRRVHAELARRLVHRAAVGEPADLELLTTIELHRALDGKSPGAGVLARRRRWRARYESEPPLPVRFHGLPSTEPVALPPGGRLEGWAASPGRFTGIAQIVRKADAPFETGRVLVAVATDASWSPLFVRAGAIVLERGGPLSHAAILARELGVPAVLNVPGAATELDGVELTVDGDAGVVVRHDLNGDDVLPEKGPQ
jgi:rifampicin phosphotransferase